MENIKETNSKWLDIKNQILGFYPDDIEGISSLAQFLETAGTKTIIDHIDTDGKVCNYLIRKDNDTVIEWDYSHKKSLIEVLRKEVGSGINKDILICDLSFKEHQMKELATILSDAMYKGKRVMWVDHHNSSALAVKEYPEVKALCGNYITEYKISSAMQIYIGTLFVKSECSDSESVKQFINENVLKTFVRLASCYDTFTDISSDAIKLNDLLTITNTIFKNESLYDRDLILFDMYDTLLKNNLNFNSLKNNIVSELELKSVERDDLFRKMLSAKKVGRKDCVIVYLGELDYTQSRIASVVANTFLTKYQNPESKPLVIMWIYETSEGKKISFRSLDDTAYNIANQYGGGGHKSAAGCPYSLDITLSILGV
jgi:oligoribonuclease NrnB/cAMP/cGMP phosphodiesterase (DHH superfamily)